MAFVIPRHISTGGRVVEKYTQLSSHWQYETIACPRPVSSVTRCCDVAGRQSADTRTPVFVSPWWRGAAAGGAAAAAGGRGGGVSRLGGGGAGEGILTTKYKLMKLIDGRTEIDQAFTVRILIWFYCSETLPLTGGEYLPLLPSARRGSHHFQ